DGRVEVTVSHNGNLRTGEETIAPDWVVACDGIHSPTRERLAIRYAGSEYDGLVMQMIDAPLTNFAGTDHLLHYHMSKDTFLMIGKLAGPNHRVLVSARGDVNAIAEQDLIGPIVALHLPEVVIGTPEWKTTWEIWIRKADAYRKGRVFLCGESAHVHSVAGGQGWNVCMQDAYNLAWKLALVIQGRAQPELLDTYQREREPVTDQVIEGSSAIHEIILSHGGGLAERMALTQTAGWQDNAVARISGLSYNYRGLIDAPPESVDRYPAIGDRLPDVTISEHLRLHQLIAHTRFTLLAMLTTVDELPLRHAAHAANVLMQCYPSCLHFELIAPSVPHPWPGVLPIADSAGGVAAALSVLPTGEFILVRPDGYVGYRCRLHQFELLKAHLETFLITA
ncbi:MAG: FAD-dependent monooxygenase, partial [Gammaproteobacteria bacterium]